MFISRKNFYFFPQVAACFLRSQLRGFCLARTAAWWAAVGKVLKNNMGLFLEILQILYSGSCRKLYSIMNITFISCWIPGGWALSFGELFFGCLSCSLTGPLSRCCLPRQHRVPSPVLLDCACSKASCRKDAAPVPCMFLVAQVQKPIAGLGGWLALFFAFQSVNLGVWSWVRSAKLPVLVRISNAYHVLTCSASLVMLSVPCWDGNKGSKKEKQKTRESEAHVGRILLSDLFLSPTIGLQGVRGTNGKKKRQIFKVAGFINRDLHHALRSHIECDTIRSK